VFNNFPALIFLNHFAQTERVKVATTHLEIGADEAFAGLDQGQEPEASRDGARDGSHPIECSDLP
jgi:hypothetical protein